MKQYDKWVPSKSSPEQEKDDEQVSGNTTIKTEYLLRMREKRGLLDEENRKLREKNEGLRWQLRIAYANIIIILLLVFYYSFFGD